MLPWPALNHQPLVTQLFPLPSLCNPNYLSPWPVRNKAQAGLKHSRKRRKVIKRNLMTQQTLLGSLLKQAWLFQPYQLLWWVFLLLLFLGNIQVRSPWLLAGVCQSGPACGIYPRVTSGFFSLLAQQSLSINLNVSWSAHSFWIYPHLSADNLFWVQQAGKNAAVE